MLTGPCGRVALVIRGRRKVNAIYRAGTEGLANDVLPRRRSEVHRSGDELVGKLQLLPLIRGRGIAAAALLLEAATKCLKRLLLWVRGRHGEKV